MTSQQVSIRKITGIVSIFLIAGAILTLFLLGEKKTAKATDLAASNPPGYFYTIEKKYANYQQHDRIFPVYLR